MALNLSQKKEVVAELADVAAKAHSLVAAEYAGTSVSQMTAMRKKARETGVYLKVVKNTLAARAVDGTEFEVAKNDLVGPLLYAFSTEEPGAAGRGPGQRPSVRAGDASGIPVLAFLIRTPELSVVPGKLPEGGTICAGFGSLRTFD